MRQTKTDRRVLWGWVSGSGVVKGGNCSFGATRVSPGVYTIAVTEPDGLPQPCSVTLVTIASGGLSGTAEHGSVPSERAISVQLRIAGTLADNDFYWTAIGT